MKDVKKTIELLQHLATNLTSAALNHKIMAKIFAAQGFGKLAEKYAEHSAGEFGFVEKFQDRILDLDGEIIQQPIPGQPLFSDVEAYLAHDLGVSEKGLPILEEALAANYLDAITYSLIKDYYQDEEEDRNWSKSQIDLIKAIGKQNYLASVL